MPDAVYRIAEWAARQQLSVERFDHHRDAAPGGHTPSSSGAQMYTGITGERRSRTTTSLPLKPSAGWQLDQSSKLLKIITAPNGMS